MRQILTFIERRSRPVSLALVLLVLAVSGVFSLVGGDRLRYPDEYEYHRLSQSLLSGQGYVDSVGRATAYRPPGWPFLLSGIYRIWDRPLAAKVGNAVAYACAAWLLSIIVARIVPQGRIFAPLLLLCYPLGFHVASTLYPQTLGALLLVAILLLLDHRRRAVASTSVAGLLFGWLVLSIPAFLLVIPWIVAGLWVGHRRKPPRVIGRSALFLLCATVVVAPWTIRNARIFGGLVPVSTNSGQNFLLGNSENSRPNSGVNVKLAHYREQVKGLNEAEADVRFRQFAFDWILGNPGASMRLYALKVLNYFNFRNELFVKSEQSRVNDMVMFVSYYPLLILAAVRLCLFRLYRLSPAERVLYLLYFGNAFASAVFFTRLRFRVPFDPLLIAIVAVFFGLLVRAMNSRYAERAGRGPA